MYIHMCLKIIYIDIFSDSVDVRNPFIIERVLTNTRFV